MYSKYRKRMRECWITKSKDSFFSPSLNKERFLGLSGGREWFTVKRTLHSATRAKSGFEQGDVAKTSSVCRMQAFQ